MTDDQLRALCLAADPVDYWAGVAAWRPPSLSSPPRPSEPAPVVHLAVIPPIAGGAPGLIDDIKNAVIDLVWDHIIKPALQWVLKILFTMFTAVPSFLGEGVRIVVRTFWEWWFKFWDRFTPSSVKTHPPDTYYTTGPPIWYVFTSLFTYPALAVYGWLQTIPASVGGLIVAARDWIKGRIHDYSHWLSDRVNDARNVVGSWITSARDYTLSAVLGWVNWLRDRVNDARDWIADRIQDYSHWLRDRVNDARNVVGSWITEARDFLVDKVGGAVAWAVEEVYGRVADAFNFIADKVGDALRDLKDGIVGGFQTVFLGPVDSMVNTVNRKLAIPGRLLRGEYPSLLAFLDDLTDPAPALIAGIVGAIILGIMISIVTASIMTILVEPLTEPHAQTIRAGVGAQLLPPATVQEAWNRELIDEGTADDHLSRAGYSGPAKEALKELRNRIPGYGDLVRFAVREAFDPGLAGQLGFVTPLPGDFSLWMERQGFAQEWAERYWWAHWDLPSVTQGFEMLHRGVIGLDELRLLLRAQDVAPKWQDRLVEIAYTLPSRVDLRRMLKAGIIDEADVLKGYTAAGYDPFWAQALTDFAVDWSTPDDVSEIDELRDLTASQIRLAYRRHVIDRNEALDRLVLAGYGEGTADFLLAIDDAQLALNPTTDADVDVRELTRAVILDAYAEGIWDRDRAQNELEVQGYLPGSADLLLTLKDVDLARSLTKAQTDLVRQRYVTYYLDDAGARAELDALEVPVARRELLVAEWAVDRQAGTRSVSLSEVRRAYREDRITEDELFVRLLGMGYTPGDAELLVANT